MIRIHFALAICLLLPTLPLAAAPGDDTGQVKGEVAVNGALLRQGMITFHRDKAKPVEAEIKEGEYLLRDPISVGEWQVTIEFAGGPKKFAEAKTSGLIVTVAKRKNTFNFDLESSPADEKTPIPKTGKVAGLVTLNGKPLEKGSILFHPTNGKPIKLDVKEGAYLAKDGLPVGQFRVTFEFTGAAVRYRDVKTTPLQIVATEGKNGLDFDLD